MKIQNRNKSLKTNPSRRLVSYLSAGVCVAGTEARAAIDVTFYAPGDHGPFQVTGSNITFYGVRGVVTLVFAQESSNLIWTQGADLGNTYAVSGLTAVYEVAGVSRYGAVVGVNYANISFDGDNNYYEGVGKFDLNFAGGAQLLSIAKDSTGSYLPISNAVTEIDAAAVPEPSSMMLGLLALGSTACARRRRHAVPR
jgi:hypothetical protein